MRLGLRHRLSRQRSCGYNQRRVAALVVGSDPFFYGKRAPIAALAAQHALPAIYYDREYVAAGWSTTRPPCFEALPG
jgi:hypothetical protein